jgi:hypothetical protein
VLLVPARLYEDVLVFDGEDWQAPDQPDKFGQALGSFAQALEIPCWRR